MTHTQNLKEAAGEFALAAAKYREKDPAKAEKYDRLTLAMRDISKLLTKKEKAKPGVKPERVEVLDYAEEIRLPKREAEKFCDYFDANGWKVGRSGKPMADWQAALRNWRRRWEESNPEQARAFKSANTSTTTSNGDPEGWREWLRSKNLPYTSHQHARGWMREEFRKATA